MYKDIELYMKCKLSVASMVKILNKKYGAKIRELKKKVTDRSVDSVVQYADVYNLVK